MSMFFAAVRNCRPRKPAARQSLLIFTIGCLALSSHALADEKPLFSEDSVLKMVLTAPIAQIYAQKRQDVRLYMPGKVTYLDKDGQTRRLDVQVRTRGIYRRTHCSHPPLMLNFKKPQVKKTLFASQDKLKLVGPCRAGNTPQQNIFMEYLAYRMLGALTENSFRTRLVRMTYIDSDKKNKTWTYLTFLLEDETALAKRVGLKPVKTPSIKSSSLDPDKTALVELFQFMIGNLDFSTIRGPAKSDCCHNIKLLGQNGTAASIVPVPYDFDFSGLVNAKYAQPPEQVPVKTVRHRYFFGRCKDPVHWDNAIATMQSRQDDIMSVFDEIPDLSKRRRSNDVKYIERFFKIIGDPKRVQRDIIGRCRGKRVARL